MNKNSTIAQIGSFVFYFCLQIAVFHYLASSHTAACFIYVAFLLLLPYQQTILTTSLLIAFFSGLLVDFWNDSLGIHAFASVLMIYIRASLLAIMLPSTARYEAGIQPNLTNLGWALFPFLVFVLIVVHHTAVFLLDMGSPWLIIFAIRKIGASVFLTYSTVLATQTLFHLVNSK